MRRKIYGQSRIDACPFCKKQSTTVNSQGLPVCQKHKDAQLPDMKCVCGDYLDIRRGKFGPYFYCMNCGKPAHREDARHSDAKIHFDVAHPINPECRRAIESSVLKAYREAVNGVVEKAV